MLYLLILQIDFQRQEKSEKEFIVLIKTTARVSEDFIGQVFDDIVYSFASYGRWL